MKNESDVAPNKTEAMAPHVDQSGWRRWQTLVPRQISGTIKRHKWLSGLVLVTLVIYCGNYLLVGPHANPNPTKRVAMRGEFPYAQGWNLRLRQEFYSTSAVCQMTSRIFFFIPVAKISREVQITVPVKRIDDSHYEAEYFEDFYSPGICAWKSGFVYADGLNGKENMYGGAILGFPGAYNKIDYQCHTRTHNPASGPKVRTSCYEGDRRSFDKTRTVGEINFHLMGE